MNGKNRKPNGKAKQPGGAPFVFVGPHFDFVGAPLSHEGVPLCGADAPSWVKKLVIDQDRAKQERAAKARQLAAVEAAERASHYNSESARLGLGVTFKPALAQPAPMSEMVEVVGLLSRVPEHRRDETLVEMSMQTDRAGILSYLRTLVASLPVVH